MFAKYEAYNFRILKTIKCSVFEIMDSCLLFPTVSSSSLLAPHQLDLYTYAAYVLLKKRIVRFKGERQPKSPLVGSIATTAGPQSARSAPRNRLHRRGGQPHSQRHPQQSAVLQRHDGYPGAADMGQHRKEAADSVPVWLLQRNQLTRELQS